MNLFQNIRVPYIFRAWVQTIVAIFFYVWIILLTSNILELNPSQPLLPDFSIRGDKGLTMCVIHWDLESLKKRWDLGFTEAPIFYPIKNARFSTDHLFGHLIYAYPLSFWIDSPFWIYTSTYQLNRLTIAIAAFLLCYWITSSFLSSFIAGGMLLFGWHFGQIANTGLGWAILALLFFMMHLKNPRWFNAAGVASFYIVAALCSGYLVFFTPIAFLILVFGKWIHDKKLPGRRWALELAAAGVVIAIALAPPMLVYKKFQQEQGLVRTGYSLAKFVLPSSKDSVDRESLEVDENERVFRLSRTASLQILLTLCGILFMTKRSFNFDGWQLSFALLAVLSFWMASSEWSPYRFLSNLPGFNGLRAVQRWYLFLSVAITIMSAMTLAYIIRMKPVLIRPVLASAILVWAIWFVGSETEKFKLPRLRTGYQVYSFLKTLPAAPICILPVVDSDKPNWARVNSARMVYQLSHHFPMVSGYSGFTPRLTTLIESTILQKGISKSLTNKLSRTGVKYVVVDSMLGDTSVLRKSLRSVQGLKILYEKNDEMVVALPSGIVEHKLDALSRMWSRRL